MRVKHYLIVPLILASFCSNAQINEVQEWSKANPSVLFVENNDATKDYLASLEEKDIDYIVYNHEVSLADINQFEAKHKPVGIADLDETDAMEIKKWISTHRDIKIIKRSIFDQMEPSKQSIYLNQNALILIGDEITLEDIRNF